MTKPTADSLEGNHPIQVVSRYTGLSSDLIRAWEKRYRVVTPARTSNGRRLYSNSDIQRLSMLRQVTQFGRRISEVAHLSIEELTGIIRSDEVAVAQRPDHGEARLSTGSVMELFDQCLDAIVKLDMRDLQTILDSASKELGTVFLIEDLISPLLHHIENECRQGELLNCHWRLFTETIRGDLTVLCTQNEAARHNVVVASIREDPTLTALRAAVITNTYGWHPIYLGERAACNEINDAAASSGAAAVIISFDESSEDARIPNEMKRLASLLPERARLIVNAPDVCTYSSVLNETEALHAHNFAEMRLEFERIESEYE